MLFFRTSLTIVVIFHIHLFGESHLGADMTACTVLYAAFGSERASECKAKIAGCLSTVLEDIRRIRMFLASRIRIRIR
jgi:hypothetical protein